MPKNKKAVVRQVSPLVIKKIKKRDGTVVPFGVDKISNAIFKAMKASGEGDEAGAQKVALAVAKELTKKAKIVGKDYIPGIEEIQDLVEKELVLHQFPAVSKAYILYRERRAELRRERGEVPRPVRDLVTAGKKYFKNQLSEFVYYTTYSKWLPENGRRETWIETIDRYVDFMKENLGSKMMPKEYEEVRNYMLGMKAMGSMRLLWGAGKAARATNVCAYNCSYVAPTKWQDFGEIMYVLMCGTGLGYSVEHQTVEQLPMIKKQNGAKAFVHQIADSKEGWAEAFVLGLNTWADGKDVVFDYSLVRPQGARLHTMGGRSSGPEPLRNLLDFSRAKMLARQGRRLTTLDVHDIICKTGEVVVMGGVRRSALISLSDLDDNDMREAKNGQFYLNHPERAMSNNSAIYNEKPTIEQFLDEWVNLVKSGSGERGIFNRGGLKAQLPARRWEKFAPDADTAGLNPCGEIVLKSKQFCNLSEVVARANDTVADLKDKVRVATILGTYQSTLTDFTFLSKDWKKNCEEERLLGVSITGHWDCPALRKPEVFEALKKVAIETNKKYAKRFGINASTAVTCVKPSGNGSQLFDTSSGCHPRYAKYYIRRIRIEKHNPVFMMLKDMGVPYYPEVGQSENTATTFVLEFPVKAPERAVVRNDINALDHLEYWKIVKKHYTEHNPSVTISIASDEWLKVGNWVYENWEIVGGLSFLPKSDHHYKLAPYEEISKERYEEMAKNFPDIDFSKIVLYEYDDTTTGSKELACSAGTCEIDFVSAGSVDADKQEEKK
ncbi:MAG: Ribonucleoside-triphosphate reductase [Parcubacteria group bacterium GW2011_GWC1_43_11b]|nr:MAG: Ribonucleoside-triphosphate reductase [Parcubacteria group bacterium GW2011_GWC1_43_11b]